MSGGLSARSPVYPIQKKTEHTTFFFLVSVGRLRPFKSTLIVSLDDVIIIIIESCRKMDFNSMLIFIVVSRCMG